MYLDDTAAEIRKFIPNDRMPSGNSEHLLLLYAVLLRAKGTAVTPSDIHDAWSVWMVQRDQEHPALAAYQDLPPEVQAGDRVFVEAIRNAAEKLGQPSAIRPIFSEILFPSGPPKDNVELQQSLELYKIIVGSSEGLVSRRQSVNTFFLTMNGALLTACGLIAQNSGGRGVSSIGVFILAVAGAILCTAWRSLIISFGQLNRGKFRVINAIENHLKTAIYAAEWEALGRGEDPKIYRSFTSREIWVPNALLALYILAAFAALLAVFGYL